MELGVVRGVAAFAATPPKGILGFGISGLSALFAEETRQFPFPAVDRRADILMHDALCQGVEHVLYLAREIVPFGRVLNIFEKVNLL